MKSIRQSIIILVVLLFSGINVLTAQQDPHFTQYSYNMSVINPAYTATNGMVNARLFARSQWVGIEGAPQTATFSFSVPTGNSVGLGLSVVHDEVGPVKENNVYGDFSYTIRLSKDHRLAFGLKAGLTMLDVGLLDPIEGGDPLNEPINRTSPNIGTGMFYFTDNYYFGVSVPNMLRSRHLEKAGGIVTTASEEIHYFLTSGVVFDLSDRVKLKPSTMVKLAKGSAISVDLSANLFIDNMIEVGLSHRLSDSVSGMVGFNVYDDFKIGYAYDYSLSGFSNYNSGSHEIMLIYSFNKKKIKNPRHF